MSDEITRRRKAGKSSKKDSEPEDLGKEEDDKDTVKKKASKKTSKADGDGDGKGTVGVADESPDPPPKFGPMPKLSQHRIWSRAALIMGLMAIVWFNSNRKNETPLAIFEEDIRYKGMKTKCSPTFEEHIGKFSGCKPTHCGRILTDELVTAEEVYAFNDLIARGMKEAPVGSAGVTIFDLSSGMLKFNGKSVDVFKSNKTKPIFNRGDQLIFESVKTKLMRMISTYFAVDYWSLFLASPVFVTRFSAKGPMQKAEHYWHPTVHQDFYDGFDYTAVLFLSDFSKDFEGGRLIFIDSDNTNRTVEARKGRAMAFTSGFESKHFNERVSKGTRLALTIGFTCDKKKAKNDPF